MKSNRRLLLAGAIAAVVVLAVPALALASVWKDKGVNVSKFVEIGMLGGELFETTAGNGMSCEVRMVLTTEGGSTGKITKYEIKKCPAGFGTFAKCEVNVAEPKGLPWTVHVNTSDLTITGFRTKRTFKGTGCEAPELDKTITSLTVTLNTPTAISEVEFAGETTGYKTVGSLTVEGANNGTYGIG
jgi:hypothetical protein